LENFLLMAETDVILFESWKALVGLAISNGAVAFAHLTARDDVLERWIASYDCVMGVYPEQKSPNGVQIIPIKGYDTFVSGRKGVRWNAVPCANQQAALKLLERFGDKAWADQRWTIEEDIRKS
jgi:hypothetical protein